MLLPLLLFVLSVQQVPAPGSVEGLPLTSPPNGSASVSLHWFDLGEDGDEDALVMGADGTLKLLRNDGGALFVDATADVGLAPLRSVAHVLTGDWDADGDADLVLLSAGRLVLVEKDRHVFREPVPVDLASGAAPIEFGWIDANGDARPDLHVVTAAAHHVLVSQPHGFDEVELGVRIAPSAPETRISPPTSEVGASTLAGSADSGGSAESGPLQPSLGLGGSAVVPTGVGPVAAAALCSPGLQDQATGGCVTVSSVPSLGKLYPITSELFVDAVTGRVGIGTTSPGFALEVAGKFVSGSGNAPTGLGAAIGGGTSNNATGEHATVAGGELNQALAADSFIGGGFSNLVVGQRAVIAGGVGNTAANSAAVGGGETNSAAFGFSTIAGGRFNETGSVFGAVGGGGNNLASGSHSVVGGGGDGADALNGNTASGAIATISGGRRNTATDSGATVGGGEGNNVSAEFATVAGGLGNSAFGPYSAVPGGRLNVAAGVDSIAAGRRAKALHDGTFVWGDSSDSDFATTASDQFLIRASGGVGIGKVPDSAFQLDVEGIVRASDTIVSNKSAGAPFQIASSDLNTNLNADLLDGLDASVFSQLGSQVDEAELADGAVTDAKVAVDAAISGTKVDPDFGSQDVATAGTVQVAGGVDVSLGGDGGVLVGSLGGQNLVIDANEIQARSLFVGQQIPSRLELNGAGGTVVTMGNVGVGTTAPNANLDVAGTTLLDSLDVTDEGTFHDDLTVVGELSTPGVTAASPAGLVLRNELGQGALFVSNDTYVGIGEPAPQAPLHVAHSSEVTPTGGGDLFIGAIGGSHLALDSGEIQSLSSQTPVSLNLNPHGGNISILGEALTHGVGIGTSFPEVRLDVVGDMRASGDLEVTDAVLWGNVGVGTSNPQVRLDVIGDVHASADIEAVNLRASGDVEAEDGLFAEVGIGTTSPQAELDVVGTMRSSGASGGLVVARAGNPAEQVTLGWAGSTGVLEADGGLEINHPASSRQWVNFEVAGTSSVRTVFSDGDVIVEGGSLEVDDDLFVFGSAFKPGGGFWGALSDARLKQNVQDVDGALDTLMRLRGVTYEFIDPAAIGEIPGEHVGFIAQEVEQVLPEWVEERDDGYKQLSIRGFTALAVEALRDLRNEKDAEIAELRARVERLESVESELSALRAQLDLLLVDAEPMRDR